MRLGPYDLESELGRGAMGVVWLGRHRPTGAARAVKVLSSGADLEALARFEREAEALARLGGRVAVPIHESGREGSRFFYGMDVMEGGSLRERIRGRGPWPVGEATELALELARALAVVHGAGIVHRDLKPENVLFDDEGRAHLSDFGCARDLAAATITEAGALLGTPEYMAPEQLAGERAGPAADVFSLGVIVYELLVGERPFAGASWRQLHVAITKDRAPALARLASAPAALRSLVAAALEPDPARRPDATKLETGLARVLSGKGDEPSPRLRRGLVAALVLVAVALASLAVAATSRPEVAPVETGPTPSPRPEGPAAADRRAAVRKILTATGAAPLTSRTLPIGLVAALAADADRESHALVGRIASLAVAYSSDDVALLGSDARDRVARETFLGVAAVERGTRDGRTEARELLRNSSDRAHSLWLAVQDVDRFAERIERETLSTTDTLESKKRRASDLGTILDSVVPLVDLVAPSTFAALLHGLEPRARRLWWREMVLRAQGGNDPEHVFACLLLTEGLGRFPSAALPPTLVTAGDALCDHDQSLWHSRPLTERALALEAAGDSLRESDPTLAAMALTLAARDRARALDKAYRVESSKVLQDPQCQREARAAIALLASNTVVDASERALVLHRAHARLVDDQFWILSVESEAVTRAVDRQELLDSAEAARKLHPTIDGVACLADLPLDRKQAARAYLECRQQIPLDLFRELPARSSLRIESLRRKRTPKAALEAIDRVLSVKPVDDADASREERNGLAVRAEVLMALRTWGEAGLILDRIERDFPGVPVELECLRLDRLRARIAQRK